MNVLINTVELGKKGGVASYYRVLKPHFSNNVEYFTTGARVYDEAKLSLVVRFISDYFHFYRKLKNGNFDLVHLNPSMGAKAVIRDAIFLLIAKHFDVKVLVFMHGWDLDFEQKLRRFFLNPFKRIFTKADAFVVLASEFRCKLMSMGIVKHIYTETTNVDDVIFSHGQANSLDTDSKKQRDDCNILYLSRVEKDKGIYETLDAFKLLKARFPQLTLTVAGDGSELASAQKYTALHQIPCVEFTGYVRGCDKHAVLSKADIYLFPTTFGEGMPTTVLEAMAYGLPVVTRTVGGLRDFFEEGRMGYITESTEPADFAEILSRLVRDPVRRLAMGQYNRAYACERFTGSSVARRIEAIYESLLSGVPMVVRGAP